MSSNILIICGIICYLGCAVELLTIYERAGYLVWKMQLTKSKIFVSCVVFYLLVLNPYSGPIISCILFIMMVGSTLLVYRVGTILPKADQQRQQSVLWLLCLLLLIALMTSLVGDGFFQLVGIHHPMKLIRQPVLRELIEYLTIHWTDIHHFGI